MKMHALYLTNGINKRCASHTAQKLFYTSKHLISEELNSNQCSRVVVDSGTKFRNKIMTSLTCSSTALVRTASHPSSVSIISMSDLQEIHMGV
jgi:hypothetical protein